MSITMPNARSETPAVAANSQPSQAPTTPTTPTTTTTTTPQQIPLPLTTLTVLEAFTALVSKLCPSTESPLVLSQIQRLGAQLNESLTDTVSMAELRSAERKISRLRFADGLEQSIELADEKLRAARRGVAGYRAEEEKREREEKERKGKGTGEGMEDGEDGERDVDPLSREDAVEKALGDAILNVGRARGAITPDHPSCRYDAGFRFVRDD